MQGTRGRNEKRAPQVIILHTPVMWGSDGVPPLCSTINSLGGSVERRRGGDGRGEREKLGGSVHSGINHLTACECVGRWEQHNTVQHKHLSSQGATGKCLVVLTDSCRGKKIQVPCKIDFGWKRRRRRRRCNKGAEEA